MSEREPARCHANLAGDRTLASDASSMAKYVAMALEGDACDVSFRVYPC